MNKQPALKGHAQLSQSIGPLLSDNPKALEVVCKVKTLDGFIAETGLAVDFIKCDVEGAELFIFQGGMKTLKRHCPIVFAEMLRKWSAKFNYHPNEIIKLLGDIGYRCFVLRGEHLVGFDSMNENTVETNFFFLHLEKHSKKMTELLSIS